MDEYGYCLDVFGVILKYFFLEQFFGTFVDQKLDIPAILQPCFILNALGDLGVKHQQQFRPLDQGA